MTYIKSDIATDLGVGHDIALYVPYYQYVAVYSRKKLYDVPFE